MRIDMPLPMPRSVMSSPIHMMRPVPAVMVMTMRRMAYQAELVMSAEHSGVPVDDGKSAPDRATVMRGRRLQDAEPDGEVSGVLGKAGLARLPLFVQGVEVRDDHAKQPER